MYKRIIAVVLIVLSVLLFSACGAASKNKQLLVGKWQAETEGTESETFGYAFEFGKDGTLLYNLSGLEEFGVGGEEFDEGVEALGNVMSLNYEVVDDGTVALYAKMFGMKGDAEEFPYELMDENTLMLDGAKYIRVQ
jgi:hypothetical protein